MYNSSRNIVCTTVNHWSLPSQLKIGHECIFTQKQDLVQFFSSQSSTMVGGCEASNGEKALYIGRTWWRSKVSADNLQKSFPHRVCCPISSSYFFQNLQITQNWGLLIHNCKPQAFVLFKGKPQVVFNGWGYGSKLMYNLQLTGSESTMDSSSSLLEALFFRMEV